MSKSNPEIKQKVAILGANFNGLVAACYLAKSGWQVEVFDEAKNIYLANNIFKNQDFKFEMSAGWYFLPEIVKNFWADFNKRPKDIYTTTKLSPNYKVFFENNEIDINDLTDVKILFSKLEPGSGVELEKLLRKSSLQYKNYINSGGLKPKKIKNLYTLLQAKLYKSQLNNQITNIQIAKILKFVPSLIYGSFYNIPSNALTFNFADFGQDNYYPVGGYEKVIDELVNTAKNLKIKIKLNKKIQAINIKNGQADSLKINNRKTRFDTIISCLDQDSTRQMLPNSYKNDWLNSNKHLPQTKLIKFAFGLDCKTENMQHHNVFYDCGWKDYSKSFKDGCMPNQPLFLVDCPSKTDRKACIDENEIIIASVYLPVVDYSDEELRQLKYQVIKRISTKALFDIEKHIIQEQTHEFIITNSIYLNESEIDTKINNLYFMNPQTNPETNIAQAIIQAKLIKK